MNEPAVDIVGPKSLVGLPYNLLGQSPETGFNCYSLVCYVREFHFGLRTPSLSFVTLDDGEVMPILRAQREFWQPVGEAQPGNIVAMRLPTQDGFHHCGVYLGDNQVLHANRLSGLGGRVVISTIEALRRIYAEVEILEWLD